MALDLDPEHPDCWRNIGDEIVVDGRTYKYGQNQYSNFWRAGPKDGTVICSKDYPHGSVGPYLADGAHCSTFEKAADRAKRGAKREYEKALEVVRRYEAPEASDGSQE